MNRPRKVFGRVRVSMNGSGTIIFELRRNGLHIRKLRARKVAGILSFQQLLDTSEGQLNLPLKP